MASPFGLDQKDQEEVWAQSSELSHGCVRGDVEDASRVAALLVPLLSRIKVLEATLDERERAWAERASMHRKVRIIRLLQIAAFLCSVGALWAIGTDPKGWLFPALMGAFLVLTLASTAVAEW